MPSNITAPRRIPVQIAIATFIGLLFTRVPSAAVREDGARSSAGNQTYWVEQVASGLDYPSSMVWLPNGDMLITERPGNVRILHHDKVAPDPIKGTPTSFGVAPNGLRDILVDPDYRDNQRLYLLLSEGTSDQHHAAVYRVRFSSEGLVDAERIFRSKDDVREYHSIAGRMLFLSDKTLLIAVTSSSDDEQQKGFAQQLGSHIGKIVRINRDGSIPADNPFTKTPGALADIWSYGHRVPLGLYQEPETKEIWEVETGPLGGDELNLLKAGGNYGWAKASWGFAYRGGLAAPLQSGPGIEDPILIWMPSQDPSGLTRYRGTVYPLWNGDYFVGHLPTKELERLRIDGHRVVLQEKMLTDLDERIRDIKVGPDDRIYILTDQGDGRLLRLRPGRPGAEEFSRVAHKLEPVLSLENDKEAAAGLEPGDPEKGKQVFLDRCAGCHSVGAVVRGGDVGPDLAGVCGRKIASKAGFAYSAAMAGSSRVWDLTSLNAFISNPSRYLPGTKMGAAPLTDPELRRQVLGFLRQQSDGSERSDTGDSRRVPAP